MIMRKRTFSIPDDVDIALKKRAADDNVRFSDVAIAAFRQYLGLKETRSRKQADDRP
jgi:hypothetical protein